MDRIHAKCWLAYISNIVRWYDYDYVCVCVLMRGVSRVAINQSSNVTIVL